MSNTSVITQGIGPDSKLEYFLLMGLHIPRKATERRTYTPPEEKRRYAPPDTNEEES